MYSPGVRGNPRESFCQQNCSLPFVIITAIMVASAILIVLGALLAKFDLINAWTCFTLTGVGSAGFIIPLFFMCKRGTTTSQLSPKSYPTCGSLSVALYEGNLEAVQDFIAKGADVNEEDGKGHSPLFLALIYAEEKKQTAEEQKYLDVIKLLVSKGARFDLIIETRHFSPLGYAISHQLHKVVEILLKGQGSLDARCHSYSTSPQTPLAYATYYRNLFERSPSDSKGPLLKASQTIVTLLEGNLKKGAGC